MNVIFRDFRDFWQIMKLNSRADVKVLPLLFWNFVCWYCLLRARKNFEFALFCLFLLKWAETSNNLQFLTIGQKQYLYLTHSALKYFEKLTFLNKKQQKKPTLDVHISKTKKNSESKFTFSSSSFNFLQNSVMFCVLYPHGYIRSLICPKFKDCSDSQN